jgi:hypothetical protein
MGSGRIYRRIATSIIRGTIMAALFAQELWPGIKAHNLYRVRGSQFQILGWCIYVTIVWTIKASLCAFYFRLTTGIKRFNIVLWITAAILNLSYLAALGSILLVCQPFQKSWQIYPDPGSK